MKSSPLVRRYIDPNSIALEIVSKNYSEVAWPPGIARVAERCRKGFWQLLDQEPHQEPFRIPPAEYQYDERGDELEIGLLPKCTGESKKILTPLEIAEGRTHSDGNKWRFHFSDELPLRLSGNPELLARYQDFFAACRLFNNRAHMIATSVAQAFDAYNRFPNEYPGSLVKRVQRGRAVTRLLRYEESKGSKLVVFDHSGKPTYTNESDPRRILVFPGTKFWGVTRGIHGTGTVHGVYDPRSTHFDATLHHDRDCFTVHWLSKPEADNYRFAIVTFVHCALKPEDVAFMNKNMAALAIDPTQYAL